MERELFQALPADALKVALVLAVAFFVGLEREEHKQHEAGYAFGGVRTFPLIGLVSYSLALISGAELSTWALGLGVVGILMALSYHHKLKLQPPAGLTTEVSALAVYIVGGLVQHDYYWMATTIGVLSVLLLELKKGLEDLTTRVAPSEIITVAKFLVLAAVILPIVPNTDLTRFGVNPFKTWLVVVAVSGVSFASYLLQRLLRDRGGVLLSAVLGGAYSSTVTTIVLSRQAGKERRGNLFAGSILTASGVMYARLVVLLAFFNGALLARLAPPFLLLAASAVLGGWGISRRGEEADSGPKAYEPRNPLELGAAFLFAVVFVAILVTTSLARQYLGRTGLYSLAALMGVADVDPFILGVAQQNAGSLPLESAERAVVIAAASNNLVKAAYAYAFADRETGLKSLWLLLGLALLGLVPLLLP